MIDFITIIVFMLSYLAIGINSSILLSSLSSKEHPLVDCIPARRLRNLISIFVWPILMFVIWLKTIYIHVDLLFKDK
jgi:hypothetical protein